MVEYEWDVEEVVTEDSERYEVGEILDHNHQRTFNDCLKFIKSEPPK